jgi:CHAT domain-containing protein
MRTLTAGLLLLTLAPWCAAQAGKDLSPAEEQEIRKKASALREQGLKLSAFGKFQEGIQLLTENLKLVRQLFPADKYPQGHPELATALDALGSALHMGGQYAAALPYYQEALAMREAAYPKEKFPQGHPDLVTSLDGVGSILQLRGDLEGGYGYYRRMLEMCQTLYPKDKYPQGHSQLARSLTLVGDHFQKMGALDKALLYYQQALTMYQALYTKDQYPLGHLDTAMIMNSVGALYRRQGQYRLALGYARQALEIRQAVLAKDRFPDGHPQIVMSLHEVGAILAYQGEYGQALVCYEQSLAMSRALFPKEKYPRGHPQLANCLNHIGGVLLLRGDFAEGLGYLQQAIAMWKALYPKEQYPNGHPQLAASLGNVGSLLGRAKRFKEAVPFLEQDVAMREALYPKERYPQGHPDLANALGNLGAALQHTGDHERALTVLQRALQMRQAFYAKQAYPQGHPDLALSLHSLGSLLHAKKDDRQSLTYLRQALVMYQDQFEMFAAQASEAESFNFLARSPKTLSLLLSVTRDLQSPADEIYADIWRSKAAIAQVLQQRHLALLTGGDERTRQLGQDLLETRRQVARLLLAPGSNPARLQRVNELTQRKEELERQLAQALPEMARQQNLARQSSAELVRKLPPRTCFVDFFLYDRDVTEWHCVAFVLRQGQPAERVELGPIIPIDNAIADWRREIAEQKTNAKSQPLRQMLWEKIARHIPADTEAVYIAPDGVLARLPWAALPGRKAGSVLLEEHAVAVVPHGPFLLDGLTGEPAKGPRDETVLAVGGVDYAAPPPPTKTPADIVAVLRAPELGGKAITWDALPGTQKELERVLELAGKRPIVARRGRDATTAQLLTDLGSRKVPPRWAHLATHGFFADQSFRSALQVDYQAFQRSGKDRASPGARNPLVLSGLVLAGANAPVKDPLRDDNGIVTAEAIAGLPLHGLDLVVLSACETGLGEVAGGEGVLGLQRAFHLAGAQNVVASLWKVNDDATAALMALFYYKLWRENKPALVALREAQLTLLRHPERIAQLAKERGPNFEQVVKLPAGPRTDGREPDPKAATPIKLWAAFVFSGVSRP